MTDWKRLDQMPIGMVDQRFQVRDPRGQIWKARILGINQHGTVDLRMYHNPLSGADIYAGGLTEWQYREIPKTEKDTPTPNPL